MKRLLTGLLPLLIGSVVAYAGPQDSAPSLDYRADRDFRTLQQILTTRPETEFVDALQTFVSRYGYVPVLAPLYIEWAARQTTIRNAALLHAEILRRWPDRPVAAQAAGRLSEILLLTEQPWLLGEPMRSLRRFNQRVAAGASATIDIRTLVAMAKAFLVAGEPTQARLCIAAALAVSPKDHEEINLRLLDSESYLIEGDVERAAEILRELLERSLSALQKQAVMSRLLDHTSPTDSRFHFLKKQLEASDPGGLVSRSVR